MSSSIVRELHQPSPRELTCVLEPVHPGFANALTRIALSGTPVLRIGGIVWAATCSNSIFQRYAPEMLENRFRLLPLTQRPHTPGWEDLEVMLDVSGPANVTSRDIRFRRPAKPDVNKAGGAAESKEEELTSIIPDDPVTGDPHVLCPLASGERIVLTARLEVDPKGTYVIKSVQYNCPDEAKCQLVLEEELKTVPEARKKVHTERFWKHDAQRYPTPNARILEFKMANTFLSPKVLLAEVLVILRDRVTRWFDAVHVPDPSPGDDVYVIQSEDEDWTVFTLLQNVMAGLGPKQVRFVSADRPHPDKPKFVLRIMLGSEATGIADVLEQARVAIEAMIESASRSGANSPGDGTSP
jgi:DNA-directed RNA polymerase subunit L